MKKFLKGILVSSTLIICASTNAQDLVSWDVDRAIMSGTGCTKDLDAFIQSSGNDLDLKFTNLGLYLDPGLNSGALSARTNCSVRIPVSIAPGYYIALITQKIAGTFERTMRTSGVIASNLQFFNFNVAPITVELPRWSDYDIIRDRREDSFGPTSPMAMSMCRSNGTTGLLQLNISMAGQRRNAQEELYIMADPDYSIRLGDDFEIRRCPH